MLAAALLLPPHPLCSAGYEDRELVVECSQRGLLVQSEDSPPLIDRLFEHGVDGGRPVETFRQVCLVDASCTCQLLKQCLSTQWVAAAPRRRASSGQCQNGGQYQNGRPFRHHIGCPGPVHLYQQTDRDPKCLLRASLPSRLQDHRQPCVRSGHPQGPAGGALEPALSRRQRWRALHAAALYAVRCSWVGGGGSYPLG